jgi:hypothetical protein
MLVTLLSHFFGQGETAGRPSNGQSAISVYKELASSMTVPSKKGNGRRGSRGRLDALIEDPADLKIDSCR